MQYDVGPNQPIAALAGVPWDTLQPGDVVRIHGRPAPYAEKLRLSASGIPGLPIYLQGVPGPNGEPVILDGTSATTPAGMVYHYAPTADRGLVIFTPFPGSPYGYKPSWWEVSGITFQGAWRGSGATPLGYTDATGLSRQYAQDAAGVFVERGQHLTFTNCSFVSNGNGFFVASGDDEPTTSRSIACIACIGANNGTVGVYLEHNFYCEAVGMLYDSCTVGPLRTGAMGSGIKDRSAGLVVKDCTITGGARLLDLVDAQDSPHIVGADPAYHLAVVEDCILAPPASTTNLIHYGGDTGLFAQYRKGVLQLTGCSVQVTADQAQRWRTILLELDTNDETCVMEGCTIRVAPTTPGKPPTEMCLMTSAGALDILAGNAATPGWLPFRDGVTVTGVVNGAAGIMTLAG